MKQLSQNLKTGAMELLEVPYPSMKNGYLIIKNHFSLISAGTEGGKVQTARMGYLGKAKEKPDQVKQVIDSVKTNGILPTYKNVMNKLDAPTPLGYSSAGEIIDVCGDVNDFKIGDLVACGGAGHGEVVSVPKNLCVKVPLGTNMEHAAYTTVASIALQGIRQAQLQLGEVCAVIGLGLLGQLTVQMLKNAGVKVAGIDINPEMVALAKEGGANIALDRSNVALLEAVHGLSDGFGVDAVIITAGTKSLDPVELAGGLCRKKGKVVIVGAVPTGFSREAYYKKELELRMSCSYGPGRYDRSYEEHGLDYPIGYARWTENRNMKSFVHMLSENNLKMEMLKTHVFPFEEAQDAFNMILENAEPHVGVLLKYEMLDKERSDKIYRSKSIPKVGGPNIGFIGAGSFAQKTLLPYTEKLGHKVGVSTATGLNANHMLEKHGFEFATCDYKQIINNDQIDTLFIATPHNQHYLQVIEGLRSGKNVFVEKPLCLNEIELEEIRKEYEKSRVHLMVGFNRRFSSFTEKAIAHLGTSTKKAINCRVNAGAIPSDHWIQDKGVGGGRIVGEVCHFIDLVMYLAGSPISNVSAFALDDPQALMDTLNVSLNFENGSIANISYFANGSNLLRKERIEVFSSGSCVILDDFRELVIYGKGKPIKVSNSQDKGHKAEVESFLKAIRQGEKTPITFSEIYMSMMSTFKAIESINTGQTISLR